MPIPDMPLSAHYEIWIDDPEGTRIALCDQFEKLDYTRVVNGIGTCVLTVGQEFDHTLFRVDGIIEVWRQPPGGVLSLENSFFIRLIERGMDTNDRIYTKVTAYDANDLLRRRIIAYYSGTAHTDKGPTEADDLMKEFVNENLGNMATDSNRDIETNLNFSIQADLTAGPNVSKAAAWRNLFDICSDIALATLALDNPIFFDIVAVTPNSFEFRTFTDQRGQDRSWPDGTNPVILSAEFGNLRTPKVVRDYRDEVNFVYSGGQGQGAERAVVQWQDLERVGSSIWNRREAFQDARNCATTACLDTKAQDRLDDGRPVRTFTGEIINSPGTLYGLHWGFGDRLSAVFEGQWFEVYVNVVKVTKSGSGAENIQARLETHDTSVSTATVNAMRDDLVAYWKMEEEAGDARDDAEGANDLADNATVEQAAGIILFGASFDSANSEFLDIADNAALSMGDIDCTFALWAYVSDKTVDRALVAKWDEGSNNREYFIYYDQPNACFSFSVSSDGLVGTVTDVNESTVGDPVLNTWYFIVCWHDPVANLIYISVNNNAADSAAHAAGIFDGVADFNIGASEDGTADYHNGRVDEVPIWKRLLTANERTVLYNGGAGQTHPFF